MATNSDVPPPSDHPGARKTSGSKQTGRIGIIVTLLTPAVISALVAFGVARWQVDYQRTQPGPVVFAAVNRYQPVPPAQCASEDCRYLRIVLYNFPSRDSYRVDCHSSLNGIYSRDEILSNSADTLCPFSHVGEQVWVVVDGFSSEKIDWPDSTGTPGRPGQTLERAVLLRTGDDASGFESCESDNCHYLDIQLENFPDGAYALDCLLLSDLYEPYVPLAPRKLVSEWPSTSDCWFDGTEGVVAVIVGGIMSNHIDLRTSTDAVPDETAQPSQPGNGTPNEISQPDLDLSWNGETWIVLSWLPDEPDSVGDAGIPENFIVQYRLATDIKWSNSTSTTSYHNGSNIRVFQYYHRLDNLSPDQQYEARVRQCDGSSCSVWAYHVFITEKPIPPPPDDIRVVSLGTNSFVLEWDPIPDAYRYDLVYTGGGSRTSSGTYNNRYETGMRLTPGTTYSVTINSCNNLQRYGDYGEEACGSMTDGTSVSVTTLE